MTITQRRGLLFILISMLGFTTGGLENAVYGLLCMTLFIIGLFQYMEDE